MTRVDTPERKAIAPTDSASNGEPVIITSLLSYRMHEVANLVSRSASVRYKREFGVLLWEWRTIALLGAKQMLALKDLAKAAGLDKSQISRVVAGLTARGLVLRQIDENDGRKIRLSLTTAGQSLYESLIRVSGERNVAFLNCMTQTEKRTLASILDKIERKAHEFIRKEKEVDK